MHVSMCRLLHKKMYIKNKTNYFHFKTDNCRKIVFFHLIKCNNMSLF